MDDWVPNVDTLTFTYYWYNPATKQAEALAAGDWAAHYIDVYRVDIELALSMDAVGTNVARTYSSSVTLRNKLK